MKHTQINKVKRSIAIVFYLLTIVFLYFYLKRLDYTTLKTLHFSAFYLLLAIPFSLLSRIFLPYIWIRLIRIYQQIDNNEYWKLNFIYAKTWLGKYIPGNLVYIAGKVYFASERGIHKTVLGITSLLELMLQLMSALLLGVTFLLISGTYSNFSKTYSLFFTCATIVGLVGLSPTVFNNFLTIAYRTFKKSALEKKYFITTKNILKNGALYMLVHSLSLFPIYFIIRSIGYEISPMQTIYATGAFIFAGAIGTLAIFVPSGLGVREGVLLVMLTNIIPNEISLVIVIILRLWSVILDLAYWILSYLILKYSSKVQPNL